MSNFIYNFLISTYNFLIWIASFFSPKANKMILGRKNLILKLKKTLDKNNTPVAWFHCASLGEFEQGRPVIEAFKADYKNYKILLTFFSPSGYDIQNKYSGADYIFYLPFDTPTNAKEFIEIVNPKIAIFVKYEFWMNYLNTLKKEKIPTYLISAIFRSDQLFFNKYISIYKKLLFNFDHIFVQNNSSKKLLDTIDYKNKTIAGDTRFDRVAMLSRQIKPIPIVENFKSGHKLLVIGSAWVEDIDFLLSFINSDTPCKIIIAPHEIKITEIEMWKSKINEKSILFSEVTEQQNFDNIKVLFIDNIGMLSSIYYYADVCWIGGAFGKGLHNILEAATFGKPIFFGDKNFQKFQEAVYLIENGGAMVVNNYEAFNTEISNLFQNEIHYNLASKATKTYVENNTGATSTIMDYMLKHHKQ